MSGHNKWSTIKHRKAAKDAKKGKIFTKLIKEITIAARIGGGDPSGNPRLRLAIAVAKTQSMPKDNIDRAIKKGTGDLEGVNYEEILYEGYGPNNVAVIVEVMTDNRNRTISNVRFAFSKAGGNLGSSNSVQYLFDRRGLIYVPKSTMGEDQLMELILEAGADDMNSSDAEEYEIQTSVGDFEKVRSALESKEVAMSSASLGWIPKTKAVIDDVQKAEQVLKFLDLLEDDDDVQKVHSNVEFSESVLAQMQ